MFATQQIYRVEHVRGDYYNIWVIAPKFASVTKPGQFFQLRIATPRFSLRIPISVFDVFGDTLVFMIKDIGEGTHNLCNLQKGDYLEIMGPLGNGFTLVENNKVLLVSGGIGYAPLYFLKRKLEENNSITWLHGGRNKHDIFESDIQYTDDGTRGSKGFVTEGLQILLDSQHWDYIYVCGPHQMMKRCSDLANAQQIPIEVSLEEYMACGIGVCFGCVVAIKDNTDRKIYKTVCKDGPIFQGNEVIWHE